MSPPRRTSRGLFAARAEKGEVVAVADGALRKVEGSGLSFALGEPEDMALLKINGGVLEKYQTSFR